MQANTTTASGDTTSHETASTAAPIRFRFRKLVLMTMDHIKGGISFFTSAALHFALLIVLALWVVPAGPDGNANTITLLPYEQEPTDLSIQQTMTPIEISQAQDTIEQEVQADSAAIGELAKLIEPMPSQSATSTQAATLQLTSELQKNLHWNQAVPARNGGGFQGRSGDLQKQLLAARGGSPATEDAVERALRWIAAHQLPDGSWSFNHHEVEVGKLSPNPGESLTKTGATGLALLPFLGKGYTHMNENPYRDHIERGLYYLKANQIVGPNGGDLQDGSMYGHGLATLALCEAYAMTEDPSLLPDASQAIRFIEYAQHNQGGWRYIPKQPGDISVFGWQLMALKSGLLGGIKVDSSTIGMAEFWLDSVQLADGAYYGYQAPGKLPSTTSIGLLSRMYLGWSKDDPRMHKGIDFLSDEGPSKLDMYYNYYATNVLCHYGGPQWEGWNDELKAYLIKTQSRKGFTTGSWYFEEKHSKVGGRLYVTCLAAMILEVYYRHMPLYSEKSLDFTF
ncbi:prenyltransferase/squalene oxidase repeat-containing protein [Bremerella cremea]|uniref:prenyltransferase/squalene oxidase repeat-containing protein n=1 Tax=Bremerella cremea TaxID=1031537 RepID=UPI0031E89957